MIEQLKFLQKDRNLIFELTRRSIKTQYRGSILGFLWTILNPLLTMLIMWLVFSNIFGKSPYYPIYLLSGNILFTALRNSTFTGLSSIDNNRNLLLRTKVNPYVFPCSIALSSVVNFFLSLVALIPFMIWLSIDQSFNLFTYRLLFILLMLPAFWLFEYGIGLFLSFLFIFFKDIKQLYSVFLVLWQYLTPIFYTTDGFSNQFLLTIIKLNPMYHFINYLRECIYMGAVGIDPYLPNADPGLSYIPYWHTLGILYGLGLISLIIGVAFYKSVKDKAVVRL